MDKYNTKPWWASKTVWGGLVTLLAVVLGVFGYSITPEDQKQLVEILSQIGASVGAVIAIYGRIVATKRLK